ncbi:hypothetical protein TPHV1_190033 [Treponema phagedenis]|uniref:Uncharacterized protein n=1 Tax=Treponema phagedenis TaxID=162 RepID=A0A0B7GXS9_TREPH|nr:hypothetical protein TPHV1_190033 [Treponema phagedenis]
MRLILLKTFGCWPVTAVNKVLSRWSPNTALSEKLSLNQMGNFPLQAE